MFRDKAGIDETVQKNAKKKLDEYLMNSKYTSNLNLKKKNIENKMRDIEEKLKLLSDEDIKNANSVADEIFKEVEHNFESQINSKKVILHIDMDAFYSQVETLDNPSYKNIPMAVGGKSMLATSNYEARKHGVRAAMPGFMALKLCPELVIVEPNFEKYKAKSKLFCKVLEKFDPDLKKVGLDEVYLDLSTYSEISENSENWIDEIKNLSSKIKNDVFNNTNLTCSIGVSISYVLSKICSQINKPNGIFTLLQNNCSETTIKDFLSTCPVSKISGVGEVTEKCLLATGVKFCGDIFNRRGVLMNIFGTRMCSWLYYSSFGLDEIKNEVSTHKKNTIGIERTFHPTNNKSFLLDSIKNLSESVAESLYKKCTLANNVTLKIKYDDFTSITRSYTLVQPEYSSLIIYNIAKTLFLKEFNKNHQSIRLLGIRVGKVRDNSSADTSKSYHNTSLDGYFSSSQKSDQTKSYLKCPICDQEIDNDQLYKSHLDKCLDHFNQK